MPTFWLSFADPNAPKGSQFLGALIVEGESFLDAVQNAHKLGCNPGGEAIGAAFFPETAQVIPPAWKGRLLSKADAERFDAFMDSLGVEASEEPVQTEGICHQHNRRMPDA